MTPIRTIVVLLGLVGLLCAFGLAILFVHYDVKATVWVAGMGAVVAIMALTNTVLIFTLSDERARFSNAFDLASKWDTQPMLGARAILRPYVGNFHVLAGKLETIPPDREIMDAVVHLVNFYWNMASAVEVGWVQEGYMRLRFNDSLTATMPLIKLWAAVTAEKATAPTTVGSLEDLLKRWSTRPTWRKS